MSAYVETHVLLIKRNLSNIFYICAVALPPSQVVVHLHKPRAHRIYRTTARDTSLHPRRSRSSLNIACQG